MRTSCIGSIFSNKEVLTVFLFVSKTEICLQTELVHLGITIFFLELNQNISLRSLDRRISHNLFVVGTLNNISYAVCSHQVNTFDSFWVLSKFSKFLKCHRLLLLF